MVVPIDYPCALHCSPAETFDSQFNRCSDRSRHRTHLEALRHLNAVLRDWFAIDECRDLMDSTVIHGNDEARIETATGIDLELTQRRRRFRVFLSFEMI